MEELLQQIEDYRSEIERIQILSPQELEEFRIKFLGTKGIVKNLFGEMKSVPAEKKKEFGLVLNDFKLLAETKYETANGATNARTSAAVNGSSKASVAAFADIAMPLIPVIVTPA